MSLSYSRSAIISLLKETLSQLRELSGQFQSYELSDSFIIRLKMMENLARIAFNYSIKVSYLNECMEYAHMAEMLDDVLLQMRRCNVVGKASSYGFLVTREYELLRDALDLIDERLKTVRVVYFNYRNRKVSKNSTFADNEDMTEVRYSDRKGKKMYKKEGNCWVDENGYRKRTPYEQVGYEEWDDEYLMDRRERQIAAYNRRYACEMMTKQTEMDNARTTPKTPEKTVSKTESDEKFLEFDRNFRVHLDNFSRYANETDAEVRLTLQCNEAVKLFNFIADNIEYIFSESRFRRICQPEGYSFAQGCIRKSMQLYNEISAKYDSLRRANKRANPTLRAAKFDALNTIQKTKYMLCKYYVANQVEKETVQYVIANYSN